MEHLSSPNLLSRRSFVVAIGSIAALCVTEGRANAAPGPETTTAGTLCSAAPTDEEVLRLETIHDNVSDIGYVDRQEIAERYGLTLIPREEVLEFIDQTLVKAESTMEAVDLLNKFTSDRLGIGMEVVMNQETTENDIRNYLNNPKAMTYSLSWLLKNLSMLPKEFYEAIRFSYVSVEDLPKGIGGYYNLSLGRIRIDPLCLSDAGVLYHEIGHAVNMTSCGNEDPIIANTLPEGIEYTGQMKNKAIPGTIFAEPYGQEGVEEDSATITAAWLTGRIGLSEEIRGTPLYEKLAIVMDRFDSLTPGMVQYVEEALRPAFQRKA